MPIDLPAPVAAYFNADGNTARDVAQTFTENAEVVDERQRHKGRAAIRAWKAEAAAKYEYTSKPVASEVRPDGAILVTSLVSGNFPGSPVHLRYAFTLEGDAIARLEIVA